MKIGVGQYAMYHGGVVRVTDITEISPSFTRCGVEFVQIIPSGEIICGGFSSGGDISELGPIIEPLLIAAARYYEANRNAKEHTCQSKRSEHEAVVWKAAMAAIREATNNGD